MKLIQFLTLSETEKLKEQKILKLKEVLKPECFYNAIVRYDTEVLLKLAIVNPEIDALCRSPELDDYWQELWRQAGENPSKKESGSQVATQEYLPMSTVSCLDLLKGLYLYEAYQSLLEKEEMTEQLIEDAKDYLYSSAEHGCFFALNALCVNGLALLKSRFDPDIASRVIYYANLAAKYYLSAGYLLLGNVCCELLLYEEEDIFRGMNLRFMSFNALVVAKMLQDISMPMINNAYQGKTLEEASHGAIKNFSHALERIQRSLRLTSFEVNQAYKKAGLEADSIKQKFAKDTAAEKEEMAGENLRRQI
ncbi:DUF5630 domain-containing protein [Legionella israelensis]|uniref:Uncharacterized protein n=1 Tax=Legionella israelensis TaxID=454 RepID=A0A0W0WP01_9GAMM|nr:DUF5630 domain-containing protein [Legionella israelensis]KTD34024.1 hypothetical protein Lisr_0202 [Legionella israelensis]QBS10643.1 hypothetical protein E4T55_12810 [Legionella israelensis]SCX84763.1 hypothetical protein SAMN02746069_00425 [Legionella israelensis DSM 19235]STX57595.1 Uncharacterised protein [Legionella israelensis]